VGFRESYASSRPNPPSLDISGGICVPSGTLRWREAAFDRLSAWVG
jgi:hypothetical protein